MATASRFKSLSCIAGSTGIVFRRLITFYFSFRIHICYSSYFNLSKNFDALPMPLAEGLLRWLQVACQTPEQVTSLQGQPMVKRLIQQSSRVPVTIHLSEVCVAQHVCYHSLLGSLPGAQVVVAGAGLRSAGFQASARITSRLNLVSSAAFPLPMALRDQSGTCGATQGHRAIDEPQHTTRLNAPLLHQFENRAKVVSSSRNFEVWEALSVLLLSILTGHAPGQANDAATAGQLSTIAAATLASAVDKASFRQDAGAAAACRQPNGLDISAAAAAAPVAPSARGQARGIKEISFRHAELEGASASEVQQKLLQDKPGLAALIEVSLGSVRYHLPMQLSGIMAAVDEL